MPIPYHGPTSRDPRALPKMGTPLADHALVPIAQTGFAYQVPVITYVVQSSDRIADVARRLYGSNTPSTRKLIRESGFYPGSVIHVPAKTN